MAETTPVIRTFKVIVDGATYTGKSRFIERHFSDTFDDTYVPTMGIRVRPPLVFFTTAGPVAFKLWDMSGDGRYDWMRPVHYHDAQALLAFHDLSRPETVECATALAAGELPVVLCGNKLDLVAEGDTVCRVPTLPFCMLSARGGHGLETPFLMLARVLLGDPSLQFVDAPALVPGSALETLAVSITCRGRDAWARPAASPAPEKGTAGEEPSQFNNGGFKMTCVLRPGNEFDPLCEYLFDELGEKVDAARREGYTATILISASFAKS